MKFRLLSSAIATWGCLIAASGAVSASSTPGDVISVTIPVGDYVAWKTKQGDALSIAGYGHLNTPGMPQLPSRIFGIAIPPGAEFIDYRFDTGDGVVLPGTYKIMPASLPRVIGREDPALYEADLREYEQTYISVYGSDAVFPQRAVEFVRTAGYRAYNLVDLKVTPFAYRPQSGQLIYYPDVKVNLRYRLTGEKAGRPIADGPFAEGIVLNQEQAQAWYRHDAPLDRGLHDFVIITLDSLTSTVTPIVDWETSKGRTVEVVTTSYINSNYSGYDLAEKMRNFLREKYPPEQWGIEDVLLIGDYDNVPMRRTEQDMGYGKPETDFYYAELSFPDSQSWDADGDHKWGEDSDPIDFYSEVNVGRIPWSDQDTVESICLKTVAYEQNIDPAFKKNILLLGAFFWSDTDNAVMMEAKVDQPWMADWTMTRMYEQGYSSYAMDYNLSHSNVVSKWSSGTYGFVNWAGHGSPTSAHIYYSKGSAFIQSSDCPQLNDNYPAIIFADACSNSDTDELNIGQSMLKEGGVAFLGATKVAYGMPAWSQPYSGSSQSLDYFFTTYVTSGDYTVGQAHQRALLEMYTYNMWYYQKYEAFEWGAIWGNPDLAMGTQGALSISFPDGLPDHLAPGVEATITVKIKNGEEQYVPGSGTLYYRYDGGTYLTSPLTSIGGELYEATLPAAGCDDAPEYYFSAEGDGSTVIYSPFNAPDSVYTADVGVVTVCFEENLDTDPGWTTEGDWAYGHPTGQGGAYGGPDPTSGCTGPNVLGYNLNGDYPNNMPERHLTSLPIDCTGLKDVHLTFQRWLGVEQAIYDHAYVRASTNGTNWTTVWENGGEIADYEWVEMDVDISDVADNQPVVYLRWTMGTSDGGWTYCGWNIDDVKLTSFICEEAECPEDVDESGVVDIDDLFDVLAHWGEGPGVYDVNDDGLVDIDDVFAILAAWGPCS